MNTSFNPAVRFGAQQRVEWAGTQPGKKIMIGFEDTEFKVKDVKDVVTFLKNTRPTLPDEAPEKTFIGVARNGIDEETGLRQVISKYRVGMEGPFYQTNTNLLDLLCGVADDILEILVKGAKNAA